MPSSDNEPQGGRLHGLLARVASRLGSGEATAPEPSTATLGHDITSCANVTGRTWRTLEGRLKSVTIRPLGTTPSLAADLSDDTGVVKIVWIGRREIPGIVPGARLRVFGMVAVHDGEAVLYNPRYDLLSSAQGPD